MPPALGGSGTRRRQPPETAKTLWLQGETIFARPVGMLAE